MILKIFRLNKKNPLPTYMSKNASGIDLYSSCENDIHIGPGEYKCIPTGIIISLPNGYEVQIRPRSGLAFKYGITVLNSPGTIDSDYRGEIKVILINHSKEKFVVKNGMRIAQIVISEVEKAQIVEVKEIAQIDCTVRNDGGFGHTGV